MYAPKNWCPRSWLLVAAILALFPAPADAGVLSAAHELSIEIFPAERRLSGENRITLQVGKSGRFSVFLRPTSRVRSLTWNNGETEYSVHGGEIRLTLPPETEGVLAVAYEGVFDDPYQARPPTMDNPGQGVLGTISSQGAFLLPGSGWYPMLRSPRQSFRVRIAAPAGMHAVTLGRLETFAVEEGRSITQWRVEQTTEGLPLCAGPYELRNGEADGIAIQTFFFPGTDELAPVYLRSSADHVRFYSELHGPYAFPKFAVVENFFPTGYGFPSFTLLGTEVLKLPFIPETSLRHEVAHCWWGNGVLVDYSRGNWSEGLTTYVADYLSRELESEEEAREYRIQVLRDFALLAKGKDFPLARFRSRTDPASRAVGYGKAMFVFHMARRQAGEDRFWEGLREVYAAKLFQEASWEDFAAAFFRSGVWDERERERFWRQWVDRSGGPILSLEGVDVSSVPGGWKIESILRQQGEPYDLSIPVVLETEGGQVESVLNVQENEHSFELVSEHRPTRLLIDPDHHVFRSLSPEELPATVNSIKGSEDLMGVLGSGWESLEPVLRALLVSLNQPQAPIVKEREARAEDLRRRDVLFFGTPDGRRGVPLPPDSLQLQGRAVPLEEVAGTRSLFITTTHPGGPAGAASFFIPQKGARVEILTEAVRKITHYGKYGVLVFDGSTVVERVVPEAVDSPLIVDLTGTGPRRVK
jgi:aminopeptidase N